MNIKGKFISRLGDTVEIEHKKNLLPNSNVNDRGGRGVK